MVRSQANWNTNKSRRQAQGKRPRGIEKRSQPCVRKSARLENIQQQIKFEKNNTVSRLTLPSPSTSNTPSEEVLQSSPSLIKAGGPPKWTRKSRPNFEPEEVNQPRPQNRCESIEILDRKRNRKRKQSPDARALTPPVQGGPIKKPASIAVPDNNTRSKEGAGDINESDPPIEYWRKTGNWPKNLFEQDPNMSQQLTKKRSSSAMSYSQGVKEGQYPPPYTPDYEEKVLIPAGIIMDQQTGEATISFEDKQLCTTLVEVRYKPPENSLFADDVFVDVMNSIRSENEPRVVRDIGPYITPSAEHLRLREAPKVKHLKETVQAEWTQCVPLVNPRPRPDFTVGFSSSAFSSNEMKKLKHYRAPRNPTEFVGKLYFPFLTCEVKCGVNGLNYADRQNMRNASTAVDAIIQLYRGRDESCRDPRFVSRAHQLHRKILAFSISHDHSNVKIYGHYALIKDKPIFHRHLIHSFDITAYDGRNRWTAYNFVRNLYDEFALTHLKRIQDAISLLPEAPEAAMSVTSTEAEFESPEPQETGSALASEDNEGFVRPVIPLKRKGQNKDTEIAMLQQELIRQRQEKEESKQQLAQEKEEGKQRHAELMDLLKEQKEELKEQQKQNTKLLDMLSKG